METIEDVVNSLVEKGAVLDGRKAEVELAFLKYFEEKRKWWIADYLRSEKTDLYKNVNLINKIRDEIQYRIDSFWDNLLNQKAQVYFSKSDMRSGYYKSSEFPIYEVTRLTDGECFRLADEVVPLVKKAKGGLIKMFFLMDNAMVVRLENGVDVNLLLVEKV
jgi:hypothetical protein